MENLLELNNFKKVLKEYSQEVVSNYKESLLNDDRKATGNLINSINYTISINGNEYDVFLNLEDYWKFVENDTKPHWPPINAILNWIRVKPVLPTENRNGKLPTEEQLAFLISRKISEEGTKGTHNLERTLDALNGFYMAKFEEALMEDLDEEAGNILLILSS